MIQADNHGVGDDEIERRVHVRIARQALLTRVTAAPTVEVALNEAVLRRPVGGREVMAGQLDRLVKAMDLPNVSIRVVPFVSGLHQGPMSGPFTMMHFPTNGDGKETEPPIVYVDAFTGALYLDKPNEIERYSAAFDSIWGSALDQAGSKSLLQKVARELASEEF